MKIEILFFEGCPNFPPTVSRVRGVLNELGVEWEIDEVEISGPEMARKIGFLGSPSVRVNGVDIEPGARGCEQIGFGCRTYVESGKREGIPSVELIRAALEG